MAEVIREDIDALNALLRVNISKADYAAEVEKVVKDYGKKINLKGFRAGKVPPGVVKKMYGNQILAEELNKVVSQELNKYLTENEVEILGQPLPKEDESPDLDIHAAKDYEFVYQLGLTPSFELKLLNSNSKFKRHTIKVDDKLLDEEIDKLRMRYGKMEEADTLTEDGFVQVKLEELDAQGEPVDNGVQQETTLAMDMIKDKKVHAELMKAQKGASMTVDLSKAMEKNPEEIAKQVLGLEKEQAAAANASYKMTILAFQQVDKAELNQEFFDGIYGPDAVKGLEEFKEKFREEFERYLNQQSDQLLRAEIVDKLVKETKIKLPDDFLKRWIKESNEKPITDEQVEADYDSFARNLRWSLIVNKIAKDNDLQVSEEELKAQFRETLQQQLQFYGQMQELGDKEMDNLVERMMQDKEQVRKVYDQQMEEKLFGFLTDTFKIKDKAVSLKEFNKLVQKRNDGA